MNYGKEAQRQNRTFAGSGDAAKRSEKLYINLGPSSEVFGQDKRKLDGSAGYGHRERELCQPQHDQGPQVDARRALTEIAILEAAGTAVQLDL